MGQPVDPIFRAAGDEATNVGSGLITKGAEALNKTLERAASLVPQQSREAGREFTKSITTSLGTTLSKPKNLAALGAGALATGALVGTGATIANRVFGRRKKDKRKR